MKSIINDFYRGTVIPREICGFKEDKEWLSLSEKINEEMRYFRNTLSEEDYNRLEKLEQMYTELSDIENTNVFACGIKLSALFMTEVLYRR